jgi:hypothetical protein
MSNWSCFPYSPMHLPTMSRSNNAIRQVARQEKWGINIENILRDDEFIHFLAPDQPNNAGFYL